ncbi:MAG: serine hydrolase domain-containing protein [Kiritimatiellia bacterium]
MKLSIDSHITAPPSCAVFALTVFLLTKAAFAGEEPAGGKGAEAELEARTRAVNQLFAQWDNTNSAGMAVAVVKDGKTVFRRGFGMAEIETGRAITPETVFDAASLAKQFTGFAVSTLIEQKKLSADDDIRKYLPELPEYDNVITISHLLRHTSGLRNWSGTYRPASLTVSGIVALVAREKVVDFAPGDEHRYSNTGYNILAAIVERVTGQPLQIWMSENVFKPLAMTRTRLRDDLGVPVDDFACAYQTNNSGVYVKQGVGLAPLGSSSLYTTADDFAKWLANYGTAKVGGAEVLARMQEPGMLNSGKKVNYGYGLFLGDREGKKVLSHVGAWGYRSYFYYYTGDKLGIVVLSNNGNADTGRLASQIARLWLGDAK